MFVDMDRNYYKISNLLGGYKEKVMKINNYAT